MALHTERESSKGAAGNFTRINSWFGKNDAIHAALNAARLDRYIMWLWRCLEVRAHLRWNRDGFEGEMAQIGRISGPALVVGSAPNPMRPEGIDANWFRISVNASQLVLSHFGLPEPHLTIFQPKIKFNDENRQAYWRALAGCGTGHLLFMVNGKNDGTIAPFLASRGYRAPRISNVREVTKTAVVADITGRYLLSPFVGQRSVSNGIFAAMLALKLGARPVVMSGFSMEDGYFHADQIPAKRNHVAPDLLACKTAKERNWPLYVSDPAFAAVTGLPLWQAEQVS